MVGARAGGGPPLWGCHRWNIFDPSPNLAPIWRVFQCCSTALPLRNAGKIPEGQLRGCSMGCNGGAWAWQAPSCGAQGHGRGRRRVWTKNAESMDKNGREWTEMDGKSLRGRWVRGSSWEGSTPMARGSRPVPPPAPVERFWARRKFRPYWAGVPMLFHRPAPQPCRNRSWRRAVASSRSRGNSRCTRRW
jgi:hypothetical protein